MIAHTPRRTIRARDHNPGAVTATIEDEAEQESPVLTSRVPVTQDTTTSTSMKNNDNISEN